MHVREPLDGSKSTLNEPVCIFSYISKFEAGNSFKSLLIYQIKKLFDLSVLVLTKGLFDGYVHL